MWLIFESNTKKKMNIEMDSMGFRVGNRKLKWMLSSDSIMSNSRGITKENNSIDSLPEAVVMVFHFQLNEIAGETVCRQKKACN